MNISKIKDLGYYLLKKQKTQKDQEKTRQGFVNPVDTANESSSSLPKTQNRHCIVVFQEQMPKVPTKTQRSFKDWQQNIPCQ